MRRNRVFRETALVRRAVGTLRDSLPGHWAIEVSDPPAEFDEVDAVAVISTGSGPSLTFAAEVKTTPSLQQLGDRLVRLAAESQFPLLFVTEYISAPLRQFCEQQGISYLDATGWAYLVSGEPMLFVRLEGAPRPPKTRTSTATSRLNGPAAGRAIRYLLEARPPLGVRQLAEGSGSSPAAVSKLMPALTDAGAIDRSPDGTIVEVRKRTLLDRWTADYSFLNSNGLVLDYLAVRGLPRLLEKLRGREDICVTGSAAARAYLPQGTTSVLPMSLLTLYAADPAAIADEFGLVRTGRDTSNVVITSPRDPSLLESPRQSEQGLPVAPLGQVLADLRSLPGRLAQEAEQLIEILTATDPAWSK
ncbi:hypothetical protein [Amycolatopsis magusensis]|uniref:hypothetical protein n=1 Tax=Amycolatopsis magusensis TaxID=882444 RepID=UPI0037A8DD4D